MGFGGKREGAGRKVLDTTKIREALVRMATENADILAQALFKKARTGDVPAIKEALDRSIGKVTDNINLKAELQVVMDV